MTSMIWHLATFLLLIASVLSYVYDFSRKFQKELYALPAHHAVFSILLAYSNISIKEYAKPHFLEGNRLFFHCTHSSLITCNKRHSSQNVFATFLLLDFFNLVQWSRVQFSQALASCLFFHQRFTQIYSTREGVHRVHFITTRGVPNWGFQQKIST